LRPPPAAVPTRRSSDLNAGEIKACRWWMDAERKLVRPRLIVAMGATAAQCLTRNGKGVLARRGSLERTSDGETPVFLTIHPSARSEEHTSELQSRENLV